MSFASYNQPLENLTTMYKINLDGEVNCVKKLSQNYSLDTVRQSLQANIHSPFLFCMKDKTKINQSDEKTFKLSEISYEEGHMKYVNIISVQDHSNKSAIGIPRNQTSVSSLQNQNQISNVNQYKNLNVNQNHNFNVNNQTQNKNQNFNINNINPVVAVKKIEHLGHDFGAPVPAENKISLKNTIDSLLGKKRKQAKEPKKTKKSSKKRYSYKDSDSSSSDSDSSSSESISIVDEDISKMKLEELNSLLENLDDYYVDELKDLCRTNEIVHSNKIKFELIEDITDYVKKCKKQLIQNDKNQQLKFQNFKEKFVRFSKTDLKETLISYSKDDLKDILMNCGSKYSGLSKEDMVQRIIEDGM